MQIAKFPFSCSVEKLHEDEKKGDAKLVDREDGKKNEIVCGLSCDELHVLQKLTYEAIVTTIPVCLVIKGFSLLLPPRGA